MVEKKEKDSGNQHFLLFPQCLQREFPLGIKRRHGVRKDEPFPKQALVFTCLHYKSSENTVGKREIAHYEQFLLFPQYFLPVWGTFCHFH